MWVKRPNKQQEMFQDKAKKTNKILTISKKKAKNKKAVLNKIQKMQH